MKATFEFNGVIIEDVTPDHGETNGRQWQKLTVLFRHDAESNGKTYTDHLCGVMFNNSVEKYGDVAVVNNVVNVKGLVSSREYNGKWYPDVTITEITLVGKHIDDANSNAGNDTAQEPVFMEDSGNLPF